MGVGGVLGMWDLGMLGIGGSVDFMSKLELETPAQKISKALGIVDRRRSNR